MFGRKKYQSFLFIFLKYKTLFRFGITMIEILTRKEPYPNETAVNVCLLVSKGDTHPIPDNCPIPLANLLQKCWKFNPGDRPEFSEIYKILEEMKF